MGNVFFNTCCCKYGSTINFIDFTTTQLSYFFLPKFIVISTRLLKIFLVCQNFHPHANIGDISLLKSLGSSNALTLRRLELLNCRDFHLHPVIFSGSISACFYYTDSSAFFGNANSLLSDNVLCYFQSLYFMFLFMSLL